jgi:hypothetical protein
MKVLRFTCLTIAALIGATSIGHAQVTVPNTFAPNTPAKAADVNANFTAVVNGVNANAQAITSLQTQVNNIPAGPKGAQGPAGPTGGMIVQDANGTTVGVYIYTYATAEAVAVKTSSGVWIVPLTWVGSSSSGQSQLIFGPAPYSPEFNLYYASPNCTGTPYFGSVASEGFPFKVTAAVSDGTNLWLVGAGNQSTSSPSIQSTLNPPSSANGYAFTCQSQAAANASGVYALTTSIPISSLGFVAPYTLTTAN